MADLISGDALMGAGLVLAGLGAVAGIKWLAAGKARQIDGLPDKIHAIELRVVELQGRMSKAEADIANDKAGRGAFAAAREDLAAIRATLGIMREEMGDLWTQVNKIRGSPRDAA